MGGSARGCRWRFKFFDSEGRVRLRDDKELASKLRAHEMCSPAAEVVRHDLEAVSRSLEAVPGFLKSQTENKPVTKPVVAPLRCDHVKEALWGVFHEGRRDGSFAEGGGRKDWAGSLASKARTHHAIFLFAPSESEHSSQATLHHGQGDACEGPVLAKGLLDQAQRLRQAFQKYLITLQVCSM